MIEDFTDHVTATSAPVSPGTSVTIPVGSGLGALNNDYILIANGVNQEIFRAAASGANSILAQSLAGSWASGSLVGRLLYYFPSCFCQRTPEIPGSAPGTNTASRDMEMVFETAEDPIWSLA